MRYHRRRPLVDPDHTADMEVVSDQGYGGTEYDVDVVRSASQGDPQAG